MIAQKNDPALAFQSSSEWIDQSKSVNQNFKSVLNEVIKLVQKKIPVILFGPPGTGKTYIIDEVRKVLAEKDILGNYELIQFHKKFSYEDFIEGFSPDDEGHLKKKDGVFKSFCKAVDINEQKINLFVIDEINRAELSTTLGEVLYLLEDRNVRTATTTHFSENFSIPSNVAILGTMNTADRNISFIDYAIRRRFRFIPLFPDYTILKELLLLKGWDSNLLKFEADQYCKAAEIINYRISKSPLMGRHMQLGHMMFLPTSEGPFEIRDFIEQFTYIILPQIEAYCGFGNERMIAEILAPNISNKYLNSLEITPDDIRSLIINIDNSKEYASTED